jgi:hypothetical protein
VAGGRAGADRRWGVAGERVPEEADGGGRGRGAERRNEEHAGRPRQARRRDLPARGQGQERVHLARRVLRAQARRTVTRCDLLDCNFFFYFLYGADET